MDHEATFESIVRHTELEEKFKRMLEIKRFTTRLVLVAATVDHLQAELVSPEQLGILLGTEVPQGWPPGEYDEGAQRYFLERLSQGGAEVVGWYGWYVLLRRGSHDVGPLIASGGFLGPPNETERSKSAIPYTRPGKARAMQLSWWANSSKYAFEDTRVERIVAHTTRQNLASCRVLERLGFCDSNFRSEPLTIRYELIRGYVPSP